MVAHHISASARDALQDLDIFYRVRVQMRSVDVVADQFQMTYLDVQEAVARVTEKLLVAAPIAEDEATQRREQRLAEQIAAERIAWLFNLAIQGHRRSLQDVQITRTSATCTITTTRTSSGQPRWLTTAARLAEMALKIPTVAVHDPLMAEITRVNEAEPDVNGKNSPDGDCSANSVLPPVAASPAADNDNASSDPVMTCVESYLAGKDAAKHAPRPVQETVQPAEPRAAQPARANRKQSARERARAEFLSG